MDGWKLGLTILTILTGGFIDAEIRDENDFQQPNILEAYEGEELYVWCASQNHIQSCSWSFSKQTSLLEEFAQIANDFLCIYNLTPAAEETGEGLWKCFINSKLSPRSTEIRIKRIIKDPSDLSLFHSVQQGQNYHFICEMTHSEKFCLWQLNGFTVNHIDIYTVNTTEKNGNTIFFIEIPAVRKQRDYGYWNCIMGRRRSAPVLLTVEVQPSQPSIWVQGVHVTDQKVKVTSHTMLEMRCEINHSSPISDVYWVMLDAETEFLEIIPHFEDGNVSDQISTLRTWVTADLCNMTVYCCAVHDLFPEGRTNSSVIIANAVPCSALSSLEKTNWFKIMALTIMLLPRRLMHL